MKILIIGATGFIGKAIYQTLKQSNDEAVSSTREFIDFFTLQHDKELLNKLQDFDIVVNAVGIIAETKTESFEQMHTIAPITLSVTAQKENNSLGKDYSRLVNYWIVLGFFSFFLWHGFFI